jgi:ComF family protein
MATLFPALLDLVFSPVCLGCDGAIAPGDTARLVCRRCRASLRPPPEPTCPRCGAPRLATGRDMGRSCGECTAWPAALRAARSACILQPPADRLVHQLKYRGWRALAVPLGTAMAALQLPLDVAEEAGFVIPVPTTKKRRRERGYNQAELLAAAFARCTGRRLLCALRRGGRATTQTVLQPAARGANVAGAFSVEAGFEHLLQDAHLILADDVLTTGATAAECARTLAAAGARCVTLITFARALDARRLTGT